MKTKLFFILFAIIAGVGVAHAGSFVGFEANNQLVDQIYDENLNQNLVNVTAVQTSSQNYKHAINLTNDIPNDEIWYTSSDGDIITPSWTSSLPSIVSNTYKNGKGIIKFTENVTSIGEWAFRYCYFLTSIEIPNSVAEIRNAAFENCTSLTSVTIGNGVTSIGERAFNNCTNLSTVAINSHSIVSDTYTSSYNIGSIFGTQVEKYIIGNSVASIGKYAFSGCIGLTSITIPNSVKRIGDYAFTDCKISSLYFTGNIIDWCDKTWDPYDITKTGYQLYFNDILQKNVTIPNSVKSIGYCAFKYCKSLASITIPNSVTSIAEKAFSGCIGLTSITIPNSVTNIENRVFQYCNNLSSVTIPNSVVSIGESAFDNCHNLNTIEFHNSLTSIGAYAFKYCDLKSVNIPSSVTSLGYQAFEGCFGLKSVTINSESIIIGSNSGNGNKRSLKDKFGMQVEEYVIGDQVTRIGQYAFEDCRGMTSVTIPNSVTSIGNSAFSGCTSLTSLTNYSNMPQPINKDVFDNVDKYACTLYVPKGSEAVYQNAYVWMNFGKIVGIDAPQGIEETKDAKKNGEWIKFLRDGKIIIHKGEKIYTLQGQEL